MEELSCSPPKLPAALKGGAARWLWDSGDVPVV